MHARMRDIRCSEQAMAPCWLCLHVHTCTTKEALPLTGPLDDGDGEVDGALWLVRLHEHLGPGASTQTHEDRQAMRMEGKDKLETRCDLYVPYGPYGMYLWYIQAYGQYCIPHTAWSASSGLVCSSLPLPLPAAEPTRTNTHTHTHTHAQTKSAISDDTHRVVRLLGAGLLILGLALASGWGLTGGGSAGRHTQLLQQARTGVGGSFRHTAMQWEGGRVCRDQIWL